MEPELGIRETQSGKHCYEWILDRPSRANALSPEILAWMTQRCATLEGEVICLSSPHPRFFSSGFDLGCLAEAVENMPAAASPGETHPDAPLTACTEALRSACAALIAVVDAPAVGAAVELLAHFDQVFLTPRASFKIPARTLGIPYHAGGIAQLRHRLGDANTFELLVQGQSLGPKRLARLPRFQLHDDLAQAQTARLAFTQNLQAQDPLCLGLHCARLRGPQVEPQGSEIGAYHARRSQAYRRPALKELLAKKRP